MWASCFICPKVCLCYFVTLFWSQFLGCFLFQKCFLFDFGGSGGGCCGGDF